MKKFFPRVSFSGKWTKAFFFSHIAGWTIAWIQTIWLVWEIRKIERKK